MPSAGVTRNPVRLQKGRIEMSPHGRGGTVGGRVNTVTGGRVGGNVGERVGDSVGAMVGLSVGLMQGR